MTKKQRKDQDRINAWLNNEPFKENSKDKNPKVPDLDLYRVLAEYYPPDPTGSGQFFTPIDTALAAIDYFESDLSFLTSDEPVKILEPCAGIGNLIYHLEQRYFNSYTRIDAFEIEGECARLGARLFPWINWVNTSIYERLVDIEGQYDFVFANPPYNCTRGSWRGEQIVDGRCKKSEHMFLEVIVRALKPGGDAIIIAPYNYIDKLPKALRAWFDGRAIVEGVSDTHLPGDFSLTGVKVFAFHIRKLYDVFIPGEVPCTKEISSH